MGGNFKVKIIDVNGMEDMYTEGKIYEIKDGIFESDSGDEFVNFKNFDELCARLTPTFELIEEEGENKMEDLRELIKPCYVVKLEKGELSKVEINDRNELCFSGEWYGSYSNFDKHLIHVTRRFKIVEIYGYCKYNDDAYKLSTNNRELLWKREEKSPTQIKLEELEKKQREIADEMEKLRKEM